MLQEIQTKITKTAPRQAAADVSERLLFLPVCFSFQTIFFVTVVVPSTGCVVFVFCTSLCAAVRRLC